MVLENEDALRAEEVADILKIGRNAVYEMAKRGDIRSYHIGRKLRFTYSDVQDYIKSSSSGGSAILSEVSALQFPTASRQFTICGQDILVEVLADLLRQHNQHVASISMNSYDALHALYKGQVEAACCHLIDPSTGIYNESYVRHLVPGTPCVSLRLAKRTQGFIVKAGNPKKVWGWADLRREDIRLANREHGSGARALLDHHLKISDIAPEDVCGYTSEYTSEAAAGTAVALGLADVSLGRAQTASQFSGVDFIPLHEECYDLVMKEKTLKQPEAKELVSLLAGDELKQAFSCANGYNLDEMGRYCVIPS